MKKPQAPSRKEDIIGVRVTPEMKRSAMAAAQADQRSLSKWIEMLIAAALERGRKAARGS
jgi:predicted HicB family RNase H-like nuclease